MAKFYTIRTQAGGRRWFITEAEANTALDHDNTAGQHDFDHDAKIETTILDEVEARLAATRWLNYCDTMRARAVAREAKKTKHDATMIARKVWAARRANGTDKRKH